MKNLLLVLSLVVCLLQISCRKNSGNSINHGKILISIQHKVDGAQLLFDSAIYTNAAGNIYSVEKLEYYLSNFRIYKKGILCSSIDAVVLINADTNLTFSITPPAGLQTGIYDSIAFLIGLDSAHNNSYGLPQTLDNLNMAWPDVMGGGYHFFKLEGHYKTSGAHAGYAMHLGQNGYQVNAGIPCSIPILPTGDASLNISMNINEWFTHPATYDFDTDGIFSMGYPTLMQKLATNGADVFTAN